MSSIEPNESKGEQPSNVWNGPYISIAGTPIIPLGVTQELDTSDTITYKDLVRELRQCKQKDWLIGASFWSTQLLYREVSSYGHEDVLEHNDPLQVPSQYMYFIPERIAFLALIEHTYGRQTMTKDRLYRLGFMIHEMEDEQDIIDLNSAQFNSRNVLSPSPPQIDVLKRISGDVYLQSKLRSHWGGWLPPLARSWQIFNHEWEELDRELSSGRSWQQETLGCDIQEFLQAGSIVWFYILTKYSANSDEIHQGRPYDIRITLEELEEIIALSPLDLRLLDIIRNHFVRVPRYMRKVAKAHLNTNRKKWSLNPLIKYPIVDMEDGYLVVPVPSYLLNKISPSGIYHLGYDKYGENFTKYLGLQFQDYVGRQLNLLSASPGVDVQFEIRYGSKGSRRDTVDFFLVTKDMIVLVEVKIYRPIQSVQEGTDEGYHHLRDRIQKAYNQIGRTYEDMKSKSIEEIHLQNRRAVGLVVTLERFHLINDPNFDNLFERPPIPTAVVSIADLEVAIATLMHTDDVNAQLLCINTQYDNPFQSIKLNNNSAVKNPLIEEAMRHILPDLQTE